jgi:hypothetical protein
MEDLMPQCKLPHCKEEAVPYGKRYCPAHKAAYQMKQSEYRAWRELLPDCADEDCSGKVLEDNETFCTSCRQERSDQDMADHDRKMFMLLDDEEKWSQIYDAVFK